jgi:hypothetical protein
MMWPVKGAAMDDVSFYAKTHEYRMNEARYAMHGRILRCPLGDNPEDCPLHDIRLLPVDERIVWLESKSDDEVDALYCHHLHCLDKKYAAEAAK